MILRPFSLSLLQDLRFISTEDKKNRGGKRDNDLLIQRRKEGALTVPYRYLLLPHIIGMKLYKKKKRKAM